MKSAIPAVPDGLEAKRPSVLVVDDDPELRHLLQSYLASHGYVVIAVGDGAEMRQALSVNAVDLIILDLMLPGENGLSLCRALRVDNDIPILMISAQGDEVDRIVGLEVGADHYLPKPFSPRELLAHVRSLLRPRIPARTGVRTSDPAAIAFCGWKLDLNSHHLLNAAGIVTPLSAGEFRLLRALAKNANRILSRDQLLDALSGRTADPFDRTVDTLISRLRRRLRESDGEPEIIRTIRGEGYMLVSGQDAA